VSGRAKDSWRVAALTIDDVDGSELLMLRGVLSASSPRQPCPSPCAAWKWQNLNSSPGGFCLDVDSKGPAARELPPALLLQSRSCLASRQKLAETDMNIDNYASLLQLHIKTVTVSPARSARSGSDRAWASAQVGLGRRRKRDGSVRSVCRKRGCEEIRARLSRAVQHLSNPTP